MPSWGAALRLASILCAVLAAAGARWGCVPVAATCCASQGRWEEAGTGASWASGLHECLRWALVWAPVQYDRLVGVEPLVQGL